MNLVALETQQHLALSASGERKKDVMINQLDKVRIHYTNVKALLML